jgi:VWFA-related protein
MKKIYIYSFTHALLILLAVFSADAQVFQRELTLKTGSAVEIKNLYGRVEVQIQDEETGAVVVSAVSNHSMADGDVKNDSSGGRLKIEVAPKDANKRIDLTVKLPARAQVKIETREGEVRLAGNPAQAEIKTETGTIAADIPLENVQYNFVWTASRPRFMSDKELAEVREVSGGRFIVKGKIQEENSQANSQTKQAEEAAEENSVEQIGEEPARKDKNKKKTNNEGPVKLNFTTARGIVLLNVNPTEVPTNLVERPLTESAKAIIKSGDSLLTEAIRRASPKHFGDYAKTLPPRMREPILSEKTETQNAVFSEVKKVLVRVTDMNNRAIPDLNAKDFEVLESGKEREILSVEPTTAPFNLVLLLDVSGSVDNYVDFIRKTARDFVNIVSPEDKIAIIIFNEDVKTLSTFSLNKGKLSESLDTFDSGGATAYYDALAYTLVDTLAPLRGERTAIVVLSDGDDNRSFLSFDSLLGTIQESGALVYPLYVPSGLIAASATNNPEKAIDPLRTRYLSLTSKAEIEGEKLAQVSGGVYYPISQLGQLQKAYEDIVRQLRTAYTVTFRSDLRESREGRAAPRLRVRVKRENAFVKLGSVVEVKNAKISRNDFRNNFLPASFDKTGFFLK